MEGMRPRPGLPPEPTGPLLDGRRTHGFPGDQVPFFGRTTASLDPEAGRPVQFSKNSGGWEKDPSPTLPCFAGEGAPALPARDARERLAPGARFQCDNGLIVPFYSPSVNVY